MVKDITMQLALVGLELHFQPSLSDPRNRGFTVSARPKLY